MPKYMSKPKPILTALLEDAATRHIPAEDVLSAVAASSGEAARRMVLDTLKVAYVADGMLKDASFPNLSKATELLSAVAGTRERHSVNMGVSALYSMTECDASVGNGLLEFARRLIPHTNVTVS